MNPKGDKNKLINKKLQSSPTDNSYENTASELPAGRNLYYACAGDNSTRTEDRTKPVSSGIRNLAPHATVDQGTANPQGRQNRVITTPVYEEVFRQQNSNCMSTWSRCQRATCILLVIFVVLAAGALAYGIYVAVGKSNNLNATVNNPDDAKSLSATDSNQSADSRTTRPAYVEPDSRAATQIATSTISTLNPTKPMKTTTTATTTTTTAARTTTTTAAAISSDPQQTLIIVGMNDDTYAYQQVFHINLQQTNTVRIIEPTPSYVGIEAAAAISDGSLYAVGIGRTSQEHWRWSEGYGWARLSDMSIAIRRHCVATVGSVIYMFGGYNDTYALALNSIWSYNIGTNTWATAGTLIEAVYSPACLVYKGLIYVFGGNVQGGATTNKVQVYNPVTHRCTLLSLGLPIPTTLIKVVLWDSYAILIAYRVGFIYNFETQIWQNRTQFSTSLDHFGLIISNQNLFVVGGGQGRYNFFGNLYWICTNQVKRVSVMDVITNQQAAWQLHAKLPQPGMLDVFSGEPFLVRYTS